MSQLNPIPGFKIGDCVRIQHSTGLRGQIVEICGQVGPNKIYIYRVRVRLKPRGYYIEVREDQLVLRPPRKQDSQADKNGAEPTPNP